MRRALEELTIEGFPTSAEFSYLVLHHPEFVRGTCTTAFLEEHLDELLSWGRQAEEKEAE